MVSKLVKFEPCCEKNLSSGLSTRSDTNQTAQPQKMVRGLKFWIKEVWELYYLCSENKGADQLRGHCAADLCLMMRLISYMASLALNSYPFKKTQANKQTNQEQK